MFESPTAWSRAFIACANFPDPPPFFPFLFQGSVPECGGGNHGGGRAPAADGQRRRLGSARGNAPHAWLTGAVVGRRRNHVTGLASTNRTRGWKTRLSFWAAQSGGPFAPGCACGCLCTHAIPPCFESNRTRIGSPRLSVARAHCGETVGRVAGSRTIGKNFPASGSPAGTTSTPSRSASSDALRTPSATTLMTCL